MIFQVIGIFWYTFISYGTRTVPGHHQKEYQEISPLKINNKLLIISIFVKPNCSARWLTTHIKIRFFSWRTLRCESRRRGSLNEGKWDFKLDDEDISSLKFNSLTSVIQLGLRRKAKDGGGNRLGKPVRKGGVGPRGGVCPIGGVGTNGGVKLKGGVPKLPTPLLFNVRVSLVGVVSFDVGLEGFLELGRLDSQRNVNKEKKIEF